MCDRICGVENKHAIYIKNFCYADSWTRNPIKKRIKLQMPKIKNQLWQQVRLAHNYQTHSHTHAHTHACQLAIYVAWPPFLQQFACQLKVLAIRYFDCCCSCSFFAVSISRLSPIFALVVCTPKKPSIQFISLSVFPLYFVVAAKIPSRKRNPQKKSAQSTKQTLKKQAKKVRYEKTKIENEKQQKREQKKRGS